MARRATITLDDDAWEFLASQAGSNRSAFINALLKREKMATLAADILRANQEEAEDSAYQQALSEWNVTLTDGLNPLE